ncbi:tRNA 2-selenouridine(34) synthase MnmH [Roseicyclus persicicus]|uniref:tRNA 2-selenouridine(34) synthase MnmH n=1 Tax=Roseicyclus persicicus TaxID=2650661 RepID=A0A7X6GVQ0_9RHOB|nr:tRNA 2-selenouridine(34) synthase MnmH [Roseibacterium persicicum]NKX43188.1 tRNA 2-selenouridine(34) synthase MnmH [Roseibacterium persicicum]
MTALRAAGFDAIIDVRSPSEYAEDRLPGAVSMPVLSDAERAEVGTIYVQQSPFLARKIGAALVARNAARHIEERLMDLDGGWRPLVYCWRGGQRSNSFASILSQIGWRVAVLEGGYREWRRHVVTRLYEGALPLRVVRLDGFTGTAKTEVLKRVGAMGGQMVDLEGLARHRGSILGDIEGEQPAQKGFESALVAALEGLDPGRPLLVEAESARIGALRLPPALWVAMRDAPRIVLEAPVDARARYLAGVYAELVADAEGLARRLNGLRALAGNATVDGWLEMLAAGQAEALAQGLIEAHYDPAYGRLRREDESPVMAKVDAGDLSDAALDGAAREVLNVLG